MTANYHTHTRWCRHATGEIEDYIRRGIELGLEELAITEHVPLLGDPDRRRMSCGELDAFDRELTDLAQRYRGQIRVIKGFECEYYPDMLESYRRYRDEYGYELLILGQHRGSDRVQDSFALKTPAQLRRYADDVCAGLRTGMFKFLAHPDVYMHGYRVFDETAEQVARQIFALCQELDIPVEINANGHHDRRGYPDPRVWRVAGEYSLRCLVNTDAHSVETLHTDSVAICEEMARENGLVLLEKLPL